MNFYAGIMQRQMANLFDRSMDVFEDCLLPTSCTTDLWYASEHDCSGGSTLRCSKLYPVIRWPAKSAAQDLPTGPVPRS